MGVFTVVGGDENEMSDCKRSLFHLEAFAQAPFMATNASLLHFEDGEKHK